MQGVYDVVVVVVVVTVVVVGVGGGGWGDDVVVEGGGVAGGGAYVDGVEGWRYGSRVCEGGLNGLVLRPGGSQGHQGVVRGCGGAVVEDEVFVEGGVLGEGLGDWWLGARAVQG